ncbi:MAG: hypothetical protein ACFFDW_11525 [Candidatus Thorarchaeota archaeon]
MNSKKISAVIIIFAMLLLIPANQMGQNFTLGAFDTGNASENITPNSELVQVTKKIVAANGTLLEFYRTYLEDTFTVIIEVYNSAAEAIYNVTFTTPEVNVTAIDPSYNNEWFTIQGDLEMNESSILAGQSKSISFTITPHQTGEFIFDVATNVTYAWGDETPDFSLTNDISFIVYEEGEGVRVEKFWVIGGSETIDGRAKWNSTINVKIIVTNFYYKVINVTINDKALGENFIYNETKLSTTKDLLDIGESYSYSYEVRPQLPTGEDIYDYTIGRCNVTGILSNSTIVPQEQSNRIYLEVYRPIYDGDNWTLKVPMISIEKYFVIINEDLEKEYLNKLEVYNQTAEPIEIFLNITNVGIVGAFDIKIYEDEYRDWVFETDDLEVWEINELNQGDVVNFTYTITPKIVGVFKIESTELKYSFENQETRLNETNWVVYSNMIELTVKQYIPEVSYKTQWWIAIGLSIAIIFVAIIPTVITFVIYSRRKKVQKGI